jgi:hypothetical protein
MRYNWKEQPLSPWRKHSVGLHVMDRRRLAWGDGIKPHRTASEASWDGKWILEKNTWFYMLANGYNDTTGFFVVLNFAVNAQSTQSRTRKALCLLQCVNLCYLIWSVFSSSFTRISSVGARPAAGRFKENPKL